MKNTEVEFDAPCTCDDGLIWHVMSSPSMINGEKCVDISVRVKNVPVRLLKPHPREKKQRDHEVKNTQEMIKRLDQPQ